jgi:hypothetical protein
VSSRFVGVTTPEYRVRADAGALRSPDDYWPAAVRKSIDAVALFGGISTMGARPRRA